MKETSRTMANFTSLFSRRPNHVQSPKNLTERRTVLEIVYGIPSSYYPRKREEFCPRYTLHIHECTVQTPLCKEVLFLQKFQILDSG